jgi:hypothetical protein
MMDSEARLKFCTTTSHTEAPDSWARSESGVSAHWSLGRLTAYLPIARQQGAGCCLTQATLALAVSAFSNLDVLRYGTCGAGNGTALATGHGSRAVPFCSSQPSLWRSADHPGF